jgi:2,3-bisphosphoglycerate-dependent phosphoglycerate mutase
MTTVVCLRHFETEQDPETPAAEWGLSEDGAAAEAAFLEQDWLDSLGAVYTSPEPKARGTAAAAAERADVPLRVDERLREVDRSESGFLEEDAYLDMVREYFRAPEVDTAWEHRLDAEARVHRFVADLETSADPTLVVSHGLLLTTMLAPILDRDRFPLWEEMGYGETYRVDADALDLQWAVSAPGR